MEKSFPFYAFDYQFDIVDVTRLPVDLILQSDLVEAWVFATLAKLDGQDVERSAKQVIETKTIEAARNMIDRGLPGDLIANVLNLPEETVESLRKGKR